MNTKRIASLSVLLVVSGFVYLGIVIPKIISATARVNDGIEKNVRVNYQGLSWRERRKLATALRGDDSTWVETYHVITGKYHFKMVDYKRFRGGRVAEGWGSEGHDDGFLDRFYGWVTKEGFDSENLEWKTLSPEDRYAITLLFQQEAKKAREEMGIRD